MTKGRAVMHFRRHHLTAPATTTLDARTHQPMTNRWASVLSSHLFRPIAWTHFKPRPSPMTRAHEAAVSSSKSKPCQFSYATLYAPSHIFIWYKKTHTSIMHLHNTPQAMLTTDDITHHISSRNSTTLCNRVSQQQTCGQVKNSPDDTTTW